MFNCYNFGIVPVIDCSFNNDINLSDKLLSIIDNKEHSIIEYIYYTLIN